MRLRSRRCQWPILLALLVAATAGFAQDPEVRPTTQLQGQIELARLVDLVSERLGLNVEYDAGEVADGPPSTGT